MSMVANIEGGHENFENTENLVSAAMTTVLKTVWAAVRRLWQR